MCIGWLCRGALKLLNQGLEHFYVCELFSFKGDFWKEGDRKCCGYGLHLEVKPRPKGAGQFATAFQPGTVYDTLSCVSELGCHGT